MLFGKIQVLLRYQKYKTIHAILIRSYYLHTSCFQWSCFHLVHHHFIVIKLFLYFLFADENQYQCLLRGSKRLWVIPLRIVLLIIYSYFSKRPFHDKQGNIRLVTFLFTLLLCTYLPKSSTLSTISSHFYAYLLLALCSSFLKCYS